MGEDGWKMCTALPRGAKLVRTLQKKAIFFIVMKSALINDSDDNNKHELYSAKQRYENFSEGISAR